MATDRFLGVGLEATPGTLVPVQRYIRMITGDLPPEQTLIYPETVESRGTVQAFPGSYICKGGWNQYVGSENCGEIFYCGIGEPVTTQPDVVNSPNAYLHTFNAQKIGALRTMSSYLGKDINMMKYNGTAIKALEFNLTARNLVELTVDAYARKDVPDALPAGPLTYPPIDWFVFSQGDPKINSVSNTLVRALTFRIENLWDEDNFTLGSRFIQRDVLQGLKVNGTMDIQFSTLDLLEQFWGKNANVGPVTDLCDWEWDDISVKLTGCPANPGDATPLDAYLELTLPKIGWDKANANVDRRNNIIQNMAFTAMYDSTVDDWLELKLLNSIASYGP